MILATVGIRTPFERENRMQRNMGTADRGIRAVVGIVLLLVFFLAPPANPILYWGALVVGIMMLGTAALGWCPPYAIFGIKTCSTKEGGSQA